MRFAAAGGHEADRPSARLGCLGRPRHQGVRRRKYLGVKIALGAAIIAAFFGIGVAFLDWYQLKKFRKQYKVDNVRTEKSVGRG